MSETNLILPVVIANNPGLMWSALYQFQINVVLSRIKRRKVSENFIVFKVSTNSPRIIWSELE